MAVRTPEAFETTLQKTNLILKSVEERLNWQDKNQAYQGLRAVLHTLRDRLTVDQAAALGAQLPMLVRGFFYEGWKPASLPKKMNKDEFVGEVESQLGAFSYEQSTEEIIRQVLEALASHIDPIEIQKIITQMPKDIKEMLGF